MAMHSNDRLNNFDLIRLLAAFQVVFNHVSEMLKLPVEDNLAYCVELFPGVPIFFVLSGFLIFKSYVENQCALKTYFVNRALRIYPALWVSLVAAMVLLRTVDCFSRDNLRTLNFWIYNGIQFTTASWWYPGYFFGYPFSFPSFHESYPNGALWSLTVELTFYVLVPVILGRVAQGRLTANHYYSIGVFFILSLCFMWWMTALTKSDFNGDTRAILMNMVMPHLWIFLLGGMMYLMWEKIRRFIEGKFLMWISLYTAVSYYFHKAYRIEILNYETIDIFVFTKMVLLAIAVMSFAFTSRSLSKKLLRGVDISYGIYIFHMLVIWYFMSKNIQGTPFLWLAVYGISIAVALLSWFSVEKPFLRLKKHLLPVAEPKESGFK